MKRYIVEKWGSLFIVKAAIGGLESGVKVLRTLVDTGSTYTILPYEILESIGLDPAVSRERVRIVSGLRSKLLSEANRKWLYNCTQNKYTMVSLSWSKDRRF
jgi:predicted aspartyl protease